MSKTSTPTRPDPATHAALLAQTLSSPSGLPQYREPARVPTDLPAPPGRKAYRVAPNEIIWLPDDTPPPPKPASPTMTLADLPDGDPPDVAAVRALARLKPETADELVTRLAGIDNDLAALQPNPGEPLVDFAGRTIRAVERRTELARRLAILGGEPSPSPRAAGLMAERIGVTRLEGERARRMEAARSELASTLHLVGTLLATVNGARVSDRKSRDHRLGLVHAGDVWLAELIGQLTRRDQIRARLERFEAYGTNPVVAELINEAWEADQAAVVVAASRLVDVEAIRVVRVLEAGK